MSKIFFGIWPLVINNGLGAYLYGPFDHVKKLKEGSLFVGNEIDIKAQFTSAQKEQMWRDLKDIPNGIAPKKDIDTIVYKLLLKRVTGDKIMTTTKSKEKKLHTPVPKKMVAALKAELNKGEKVSAKKKAATKKALVKKKAKVSTAKKSARNKGAVAKVHSICDKLYSKKKDNLERKHVLAACEKAGINKHTAATQYQKWMNS